MRIQEKRWRGRCATVSSRRYSLLGYVRNRAKLLNLPCKHSDRWLLIQFPENKRKSVTTSKNQQEFQITLCTCPDSGVAEIIARSLVQSGRAACVNIIPGIQSVYKWEGEVKSGTESLLVIKSKADAFAGIKQEIVRLHPYELPEIIAVPIVDGLKGYLAWLSDPEQE